MRPLATDEQAVSFWLRHVRVNVAVSMGICALLILYVILTWAEPRRVALGVLTLCAMAWSGGVLLLPWRRLVRHETGSLAVYVWGGVALAFITSFVVLDGGAGSPLAVLLFLLLISVAMSWRPPAVITMGVAVLLAYASTGLSGERVPVNGVVFFTGALFLTVVLCAANAKNRWTQLDAQAQLADRLARLADHDSLTGCVNHRSFHQRLRIEADRALRYDHPVWLLILDLDDFKRVNDRYGHPGGDRLLEGLGHALRRATRESDVVGRIGGDEFAILSPGIDADGALLLAERVRREMEQVNDPAPVTVSVGVSGLPGSARDGEALLRQADAAVYTAKRTGRDRVVMHAGASDRDNGCRGTGAGR